ncbi:hypothetical protein JB92DRAFT_3138414 [Gautieria morchelliformis]|nr:hypothetical protein JB92DRAFT_3138414 [Gautieria morchelliformis]
MSTINLTANLCVTGGHRQTTSPTYYCHYNTVLQTTHEDMTIPVDIHVYSPPGECLLPDNTIAHIVGRIFGPPSSKVLMDVISIVPYPGDPKADNYEDNIPDDTSVAIWGVGAVISNAEYGADSKMCIFNLAISDYVRDATKSFTLGCIYDGNSVRWNRTPAPNINTVIYVYGLLKDVDEQGNLSIVVDHVALNLGSGTIAGRGGGGPDRGDKGSHRRRKFTAAAVDEYRADDVNRREDTSLPAAHSPSNETMSSAGYDSSNLMTRSADL